MVPSGDWLCRFVRYNDWNFEESRPWPTAFRASDRQLSVFHVERVEQCGCALQDLCINSLAGAGEAHLRAEDYITAGRDISPQFNPKVYWRPESVGADWGAWRDAHAQVESEHGNAKFPQTYRVALALSATPVRPPTKQ